MSVRNYRTRNSQAFLLGQQPLRLGSRFTQIQPLPIRMVAFTYYFFNSKMPVMQIDWAEGEEKRCAKVHNRQSRIRRLFPRIARFSPQRL